MRILYTPSPYADIGITATHSWHLLVALSRLLRKSSIIVNVSNGIAFIFSVTDGSEVYPVLQRGRVRKCIKPYGIRLCVIKHVSLIPFPDVV